MYQADAPRTGNRGAITRMLAARAAVEDGFTLIELLVVLLILAILLAVAIPTFLGTSAAADASQAEVNLQGAAKALQAQWSQAGAFESNVNTEASDMTDYDPSVTFETSSVTPPANDHTVSLEVLDGDVAAITLPEPGGTCLVAEVNESNGSDDGGADALTKEPGIWYESHAAPCISRTADMPPAPGTWSALIP